MEMPDMFFPAVHAGRVVRTLLENAAEAEADGDAELAAELLDRAIKVDNARR